VNLFTIPPATPFLDTLAAAWLADSQVGADPLAVADGLILLPTRRAARALAEAFLRASGGAALILPRIVALGALDEAPLALAGSLDLPPAVPAQLRLAALAKLILALPPKDGGPSTADRAWLLAAELAALMDEAERAGVDLAERLPGAADPAYAEHWARTLDFLAIVTRHWPDWLEEQGMMNPAARQVALLRAQAAAWAAEPPAHRVLLAGVSAAFPAVAELARVIAGLPQGAVVLAGLDTEMSEAAWDGLDAAHPQAGLKALLGLMGARRGDVRSWGASRGSLSATPLPPGEGGPLAGRSALLRRALLPGVALAEDWTRSGPAETDGLTRLEAADQQEEAAAIALILRDALEQPGARAALITPDRALAGRVSVELLRYGIVADDSAGERLAETPPAVFLRLLARAAAEELAPVPLLALLKHPLAAAGLAPAACREAARVLERARLRGPRPGPGVNGLRYAARGRDDVAAFLDRLAGSLAPLLRVQASRAAAPGEALAALIEAAERLAATDKEAGPARLWAGEEGEALAEHLAWVLEAVALLPDQGPRTLPGLLEAVLATAPAIRTRRALRGRAGAEHPRIFIWGLLEARLQSVDRVVLGSLVEGIWPPATEPGPWLSRPMRDQVGLPAPEEAVGQAAHDFVGAALAAREVVLSCPRRIDGAPAVPARWLTRIEAFLHGRGQAMPRHPAAAWVRRIDQPDGAARAASPPQPRPPLAFRPRRLSVTEIETWLRDPYAIYARRILGLEALRALDEDTDAADYGNVVHAGLHRFLEQTGTALPADAARLLREAFLKELATSGARDAVRNWWEPRLARIADWVVAFEARRRGELGIAAIHAECQGTWELERPGGVFVLTGRADRIERRDDGTLAIIDYKTGQVPSQADANRGLAPQLPLEAAMAQAGGFGAERAGTVAELAYWRLSGGPAAGEESTLYKEGPSAVAEAVRAYAETLRALIDAFDDPSRPYLSQPHPARAPRFTDYAQLARVAEWQGASREEQ